MNVEERVRESLQRAGHGRRVDVPALHAATQRALLRSTSPVRGPRWRPAVLGATAAALAITGVVALPHVDFSGLGQGPSGVPDGGVDNDFTCVVKAKSRVGSDDSFLPKVTGDLRPAGEAAGAPRWESEPTSSGAVLRLGNADGTLASVVQFEKVDDGFRAEFVTKCVNDRSANADLVQDRLPPLGPDAAQQVGPGAQLIVDRMTYDVRGLGKRWSIWAAPCGPSVCLTTSGSGTQLFKRLTPDLPQDVSTMLADPDDVVGQDMGLRLVTVYDPEDELDSVDWNGAGPGHFATALRGGWAGQLFVFITAETDIENLHLHPKSGETRSYQGDDFLD